MQAAGISRRHVITGLSSVGLLPVVGCLASRRQRLTLGVGPTGSRSHHAGQALAVAVDQHSESLSLSVESIEEASDRIYAASKGEIEAVGVDNTTLHRASERLGTFDIDPVERLPHQGFVYGRLDHYWLAVTEEGAETASLGSDGLVIYPVQPGKPSRRLTEQLLREAGLWELDRIDNRPLKQIPAAVADREVDCFPAVEINGRQLAPWCRQINDRIDGQLALLPVDDGFERAIESAPNAVSVDVEPADWTEATLPDSVTGWGLPMQWLFAPTVDSEAVAELTRIAHEHTETVRTADRLALDRSEPAAMTEAVMEGVPIHEGAASVFEELGVQARLEER